MRVTLSWLVELVPSLAGVPAAEVAERLVGLGVEVEEILTTGPADIDGLVVGQVLEITELTEFKKPIRFCRIAVAPAGQLTGTGQAAGEAVREIVCGASNFAVGDKVVVALPGALLPGDFRITARKTYGQLSDGMICSARELGIGEDQGGILVLPPETRVGADAVSLLGLHDTVLVTEPTPDRGYQLSMRGMARELAAVTDEVFTDPAEVELGFTTAPGPEAGQGFPVVLSDPAAGRFCARVVRGFDPVAPSPLWMRTRLARAGMRSVSLAVDVTNYLTLLLGQPMHAYDLSRLTPPITVRRAREGERLRTLDGVNRELAPGDDLLITDGQRIQGIAGVMGGADSEVGPATSDLLLEAAHFEPRTVSRAVRGHGLLSEAGRRFERGVDPALPPRAIELATRLLVEYGGGTAEPLVVDAGHTVKGDAGKSEASIDLDPARISALLGLDYPVPTVIRRLQQVGCQVAERRTGSVRLTVTPPSWRFDLAEAADLAEEVARLEGYDAIPSVLPPALSGRGLTDRQRRRRAVSRALAHAGLVETPSFPFQSGESSEALGFEPGDPRRRMVRLANPVSAEEPFLRTSLLPSLLTALARNSGRGAEDVALFEFGTVFSEPDGAERPPAPVLPAGVRPSAEQLAQLDAALPVQREHVAVVLSGAAEPAGWWGPARPASWSDAVEAARLVVEAAGGTCQVRAVERAPWHPGRCAEVSVRGRVLGYAGELHPRVVETLGLPGRTSVAELELGLLLEVLTDGSREDFSAPAVSSFPPATQDVALVVDAGVPAAEVEAALRSGAGELLEDVRLFDVFTGDQIGVGQRSLAYTLRFRAPDRTLTAEEATAARQAAVEEAALRCGAVQRV
jgi:phenylalanyl-tRNA synthetase beta chain